MRYQRSTSWYWTTKRDMPILQYIAMGRYGAGTREDDGRWYGDYGRKRGWTSKPCGWNWLDIFWEVLNRLEYVIIPEGTSASTLTLACQLRYCMLTCQVSEQWLRMSCLSCLFLRLTCSMNIKQSSHESWHLQYTMVGMSLVLRVFRLLCLLF